MAGGILVGEAATWDQGRGLGGDVCRRAGGRTMPRDGIVDAAATDAAKGRPQGRRGTSAQGGAASVDKTAGTVARAPSLQNGRRTAAGRTVGPSPQATLSGGRGWGVLVDKCARQQGRHCEPGRRTEVGPSL